MNRHDDATSPLPPQAPLDLQFKWPLTSDWYTIDTFDKLRDAWQVRRKVAEWRNVNGLSDREYRVIGLPESVSFTFADGRIGERRMRPVLDENGGWIYWVDCEAAQ